MFNILKSIDRLGREFKFKINGEDSFKTQFGGVISILYYVGVVSLFGFFGKELVLKEDPNFIHT